MNWNAYVLNLSEQGYSPEQIVAEANMPLLTLEYVNSVLEAHRLRYKPNYSKVNKYKNPATEENKRLLEYVKSVGEDTFRTQVKELGYEQLAVKLNTTAKHLRLFHNRYVEGFQRTKLNRDHPTYEKRLVAEGKLKPAPKKVKPEDIMDLW